MDSARMLGEILMEDEGVDAGAVASALDAQRASRGRKRLGAILVELGEVKSERLARALASQFGLTYVDPLASAVDPVALWKLPRDVAERHRAIPLKGPHGMLLAMSEPRAGVAVREIAGLLGVTSPAIVVGAEDRILEAIRRHYDASPAAARAIKKLHPDERPPVLSPTGMELDARAVLARLKRGPGKPVQEVTTMLLAHAIELGASELRIDSGIVRHVYDGVPVSIMEVPAAITPMLVARLKVVAGLEPGDVRKAVEARAVITVGERSVPTVSVAMPGPAGGSVSVQFVHSHRRTPDLGMVPAVEAAWTGLIRGSGLVLLVGPEGSGCATTATAAGLPVTVLKDAASVDAALAAAERGELVLGRVHTHGIPEAIARLRELGAPGTTLAATFRGALTQRLARRVCAWCSPGSADVPVGNHGATAGELAVTSYTAPMAGPGCPACRYRGMDGIRGLFELVVVDDGLRDAIADGAPLRRLGELSVAVGRKCLRAAAMARASEGEVPLSEVQRVVPVRPPWGWSVSVPVRVPDSLGTPEPRRAAVTPPRLSALVLDSDLLSRPDVEAEFGERVGVRFVRTALAARGVLESGALTVALVAITEATELLPALRERGARVVIIGVTGELSEMREAFAMGADDYAPNVTEAAVRAARWMPAA